jgi:predicted nuclease with TOPRIM domain
MSSEQIKLMIGCLIAGSVSAIVFLLVGIQVGSPSESYRELGDKLDEQRAATSKADNKADQLRTEVEELKERIASLKETRSMLKGRIASLETDEKQRGRDNDESIELAADVASMSHEERGRKVSKWKTRGIIKEIEFQARAVPRLWVYRPFSQLSSERKEHILEVAYGYLQQIHGEWDFDKDAESPPKIHVVSADRPIGEQSIGWYNPVDGYQSN